MVKVMPSIENEDQNSRVYNSLPFESIDCCCSDRLLYHKLPEQLIKLSILKLDGSSFDVCVGRNATIAELKWAVEGVFSLSPKEGEANISWCNVWGHFCLCYEGQKLLNDKVHLRNFRINDGDQLKFIQHMSINYAPSKQVSKKTGVIPRRFSMCSLQASAYEEEEPITINENMDIVEGDEELLVPNFKLAHFLRSHLSYAKLRTFTRRRSLRRDSWSRFSLQRYGS